MYESHSALQRGLTLVDLGRFSEAEEAFRTALSTEPDSVAAVVGLARSLNGQGRFEEAEQLATQALSMNPASLNALLVLSSSKSSRQDYNGAYAVLQQAIQMAPGFPDLWIHEGALLHSMGHPEAALGSLARARALDPTNPDGAVVTASALIALGRLDEAAAAVAEALRLDPSHAQAHLVQGDLQLARGGGSKAVDAHRSALQLDPTSLASRQGMALALKSRNPLYGLLLRADLWLNRQSSGMQWAIRLAPLIAFRLLRPVRDQVWAQIVLSAVFAVVALTWMLDPLMNASLLVGSYSRQLLDRVTKLATIGFLVFLMGAIAAALLGWRTGQSGWLVLALGVGLWSFAVGGVHRVKPERRRLVLLAIAVAALVAIAGAAAQAVGSGVAGPISLVLVLSAVAMTWVVALT